MLDCLGHVAAVTEQDLNDLKHDRDAFGHGLATLIRLWIRSGSETRGVACGYHNV